MVRFYLAAPSAYCEMASELIDELTRRGWRCTYNWTDDINDPKADLVKCAVSDIDGVGNADVVIALAPETLKSRGVHVEIGAALALGTQVLMVIGEGVDLDDGYRAHLPFYEHPHVSKLRVSEETETKELADLISERVR